MSSAAPHGAAVPSRPHSTSLAAQLLLAAGSLALPMHAAQAQAAPEAKPAQGEATTLPTVRVTGSRVETNTLQSSSGVARIQGPVQDIPQVVNVVPQEVLQQQQVTTLEQALRNVPGITVTIGEARGGANGDQFRIRGASGRNDAYLDGLRDFGVYVRDTFNTEQVEVLKGPSSENFGMGSTGGAINSETKRAHLGNDGSVEAMLGNGPMNRQTLDVNRQLNETTALRINAMRQDQKIVDRDGVESDRWGLAASLGLGLGTATNWHLNYMHQSNDRTPDFGQPMIGRTARDVRRPIQDFGVSRSIYYGKDNDQDRTDADILTSIFKHRLSEKTTLSNETRLGYYERRFGVMTPVCSQAACMTPFFTQGDGPVANGGDPHYTQRSWGVQNVTTLATAFETGGLQHDARLGVDIARQKDHRQAYALMKPDMSGTTSALNKGTLRHPNHASDSFIVAINPNGNDNVRDASLTDIAFFASDHVHFTPQWSLLGSLRWDYYKQSSRISTLRNGAVSGDVNTISRFISPRLSLMWEPSQQQTYYLSYGWASSPPWAGSISGDYDPLGAGNTGASGNALRSLDPEKTRTLELGGKLSLLDERLGLSGAIFRTEKNNTYYDDGSGGLVSTGNKERYTGLELGVAGQITREWSANLNYTYLRSKITDAAGASAGNIGNPVQGVPRHAVSLWTSYDLTPVLAAGLPGRLTIGGGLTYRGSMYARDDKMAAVPHNLSYDAMVAYEYKNLRFALNGYNLANRVNYDAFFAGPNADSARLIPAAGRTFVLSARVAF
ncbi:TonB-dependent receptor [Pseudorhodoferax sp.]|uniref:TonB-dependent receptor n=1 Tax=Pseudorhodoferax sp. TaxID=1993553 RepID=UPI0039E6431C